MFKFVVLITNKDLLFMVISYVMTYDTGFAPNPYFGKLTLATCKPVIRKSNNVEVGDWLAGWAGSVVRDSQGNVYRNPGSLVYLARISEIVTIDEYWFKYPEKRCEMGNGDKHFGDNIYKPLGNGSFEQCKNPFHGPKNIPTDLNGRNVLVCDEFYYFGIENAITVDSKFSHFIHRGIGFSYHSTTEKEMKELTETLEGKVPHSIIHPTIIVKATKGCGSCGK